MHTSILTVGSDEIFATLPNQISYETACNVENAVNIEEAQNWIEVKPPDVLIVKASLNGSLELCHWLKQQMPLAWVYCILLEDRPQIVTQKSRGNWRLEVEMTATVLEDAADAYIWLPPSAAAAEDGLQATTRLLLAHIQVGLRKVKKYRDLMQTNDLLSAIAYIDPLTELNNRRALEINLRRQIRSSLTYGTSLSALMLDVDHFKVINDTYGHLVGDRILKLVGARLRSNLRAHDLPFRYGGEEFVILLHNTNCTEALVVARRLHSVISKPFAIDDTLTINVTVSIGADCLRNADDPEGVQLLARTDQFLLQAKAAGRNCIVGCENYDCAPVHV